MTCSRRPRAPRLTAALALTALSAALLPAAAGAAPSGATTLELTGSAAKALSAQQVKISAQKPATASSRRIVLPVTGGSVAGSAKLTLGGTVSFRARAGRTTRTVKLSGWQTAVGASTSKVSAKLGTRRVVLFTIATPKRRVALDKAAGTASLTGGRASLTTAGAKALRSRLALRGLTAGPLGGAKVTARLGTGTTTTPTTPTGPATPTPTTPTTPANPTPAQCSGFSTGTVPEASAPLARPAGATDVSAAPMQWYGRDSWIRYINGGLLATDGFIASDGAQLGPVEKYPEPTDTFPDPSRSFALAYSATFTFDSSRSWYLANGSSSTGVLAYTGTVRFRWDAHGIDLTFKNPEIELNGASSRLVFTVAGAACSNFPAKRVNMFKLTVPAPTGAANPYAYTPIAARISADGGTLFSSQYFEGNPWGSVRNLSITTP